MKIKKIIAAMLALSTSAALLGGCGGSKKAEGDSDRPIKISIAQWPDEEADPKSFANAQEKKKEFEEKYPDIEIIGEHWNYEISSFIARAEGGTLPTLYTTYFTEAKKIIDLNYAADITEALKSYGYYDKINETLLPQISRDGSIYLFPNSAYTLGIVINKKLFAEAGYVNADGTVVAPKTFEELADMAKTISEKTGKAGFVFPTTSSQGGWNFTMLAWNFGTEFEKKEDGKWKAVFDSEECAQALEYLKDLKWNKKALPSNTNINAEEVMKLIGTNQAAMAIVHPGQLNVLKSNYGMNSEDIAMVTMPAGPKRHVTLMGGSLYGIAPNATPEQIDAVFKWLEFNGDSVKLDDEAKARYETDKKLAFDENLAIIGVKDLSVWNNLSEAETFKNEIMEKYRNIPKENVIDYNENKNNIEYQAEEAVCAQELYAILDSCIQEIFNKEDSDCSVILKKAASDFQANYLDYEN